MFLEIDEVAVPAMDWMLAKAGDKAAKGRLRKLCGGLELSCHGLCVGTAAPPDGATQDDLWKYFAGVFGAEAAAGWTIVTLRQLEEIDIIDFVEIPENQYASE